MGAGFSYLYHRLFGGGEYKVVMVGLDNAGKSTILYRLCAGYLLRPRSSRVHTGLHPPAGILVTSSRRTQRLEATWRR